MEGGLLQIMGHSAGRERQLACNSVRGRGLNSTRERDKCRGGMIFVTL